MDELPEDDINILGLRAIIDGKFPGLWAATEACLATAATLFIKDVSNPTVLTLVGAPSSSKTTVLSFFKKTKELIYFTDKFTPKSFVSCFANTKAERLAQIDLLPRIKHKIMIVPELAPIFRARKEDLTENFAILTRIFDGQGLWVDSGTTGGRGYEGDYMFCWLGATTPIDRRVWATMATLGSRMFFFAMNEDEKNMADLVGNLTSKISYKEKCDECQWAVDAYLKKYLLNQGLFKIQWNPAKDEKKALEFIANLAMLLSHLRGTLQIWAEGQGDGDSYIHRAPIIEQPDRANMILYNFARGRAVLRKRNHITEDDVRLVSLIALSSMPEDRRQIFRTMIKNNGTVGTSLVSEALGCSPKVAKGLMEEMVALRVCEDATAVWGATNCGPGSDEKAIRIRDRFSSWLLSPELSSFFSVDLPPKGKCSESDAVI